MPAMPIYLTLLRPKVITDNNANLMLSISIFNSQVVIVILRAYRIFWR